MPEKQDEFMEVFQRSKEYIRGFEGCIEMRLLKSLNEEGVFFTYSLWQSEEALNKYRNSARFREIWSASKACFSAKAEATSLVQLD